MTTPALAEAPTPGLLRQLSPLLRPWRGTLAIIAGTVLLAALLELVPPLVLRSLIDGHLSTGDHRGLLTLALVYLGATAAVQGLSFAYGYLAAVVAQGVLHGLRVRLFGHLLRLPMAYHDRTPAGDSISRCTADIETVETLFSSSVSKLVAETLRLATVGAAMVALSPLLSLVTLALLPPLAVISRYFQVHVRNAERENRRATGTLNAQLQEDLAGAEVVRAYGREESFVRRFRIALRDWLLAFNRSTAYNSFYAPITSLISSGAIALLLWWGAGSALGPWGVSLGTLAAFVLLFQRFFQPIISLGDEWQTVQGAFAGAERVFAVLALPLEEPPLATMAPLAATAALTTDALQAGTRTARAGLPAIELKDVTFGYYPQQPVLRSVSFALARDTHIALVGRTGSGKSTTLGLLTGFYTPWAGSVTIAGVDPRTIGEGERRRLVGFVPQAVQLFFGTVLDNLTLHDASVPRIDVEHAAMLSGADAFIRAMPQGYDTLLSGSGRGRGMQLSAGQRQLLALARALVWKPSVLLLDEATAAVDPTTEAAFRAGLREAAQTYHCAVLTVAHRLATAREADFVIVLDGGRVVEFGEPGALLARNGRFAALLALEAAGWDWRA